MKLIMKRMLFVVVTVLVGFSVTTVSAAPSPLTEAELDEQAALIVEAQVVGVEVLGETLVPNELHKIHLEATLDILETYKGSAPEDVKIRFDVDLIEQEPMSCDMQEPAHWEGEISKLWLDATPVGTYTMTYWNGQAEAANSDPKPMTTEEMLSYTNPTNEESGQGGGCSVSAFGAPTALVPLALAGFLLVGLRFRRTDR